MDSARRQAGHYSAESYLQLADCGILSPDDRVELLDGLVVAMPPPSPRHDAAVEQVQYALLRGLGLGVTTRVQCSLVTGSDSVPQPDVMVIPGRPGQHVLRLPSQAHLVVEVALASLAQDRLTKSAIYARAGVPCYWIVNLRENCVEVYRDADSQAGEYRTVVRASGDDILIIDAFPDVTFRAKELLPAYSSTT